MQSKPRVLLLGDSIRMSYQPIVTALLADRAEVVGPPDNCQYSLFTLSSLDRWIQALGKPDIVHWNNGLHDCGHNPNRVPTQIPLEMYTGNLRLIIRQLRTWTPRIIWATMTPVHTRRPFLADQWSWRTDEVNTYNEAALRLMKSMQVPVNDLHALVEAHIDEYIVEDGVHLNQQGQEACAKAVVKAVSACLG